MFACFVLKLGCAVMQPWFYMSGLALNRVVPSVITVQTRCACFWKSRLLTLERADPTLSNTRNLTWKALMNLSKPRASDEFM